MLDVYIYPCLKLTVIIKKGRIKNKIYKNSKKNNIILMNDEFKFSSVFFILVYRIFNYG